MAHPYYPQQGGRGGPGGYGMRGRGIGGGAHPGQGHPIGMMGHQGGPGGGMGDSMMRGEPMGMGRGYDRGGYEMQGGPQMGMGPQMGGGPIRRGVPPPAGSPRVGTPVTDTRHQSLIDDPRTQVPGKQPPGKIAEAVRYANDCEIIVAAKAHQAYAEMIEKAIRDLGLKVDLMFPKPDVKLSSFIDNIATMGTIFAVVIRPDNEDHRSVSVHVLRGPPKPEEHRNMPLSAAYQLIQDRYRDLKRKEVGVVPENIKVILKLLLEERMLTELDYTAVIKFLQQRRRKQNAFEKRTSNVVNLDQSVEELSDCPEAKELQERILSILNGKADSKEPNKNAVEGERIGDLLVPRPKEPLGVLDADPSVQNALNTLMNPAFLSVLNSASGNGQISNPQPAGRGGGFGRGKGFGRGGGGY